MPPPTASSAAPVSSSALSERPATVSTVATGGGLRRASDHRAPAVAVAASSKSGGESQETVVDSGIEELDSRSSSDHHLDSILAMSRAERLERGGGVLPGEGDRVSADLLESYMSYLDGQSFEMHNAKTAAAGAAATSASAAPGSAASTYPKVQRYREGVARRQTSTAPAAYRRREQRQEEEEDEEEAEAVAAAAAAAAERQAEEDGYRSNLSRSSIMYYERPRTPEMKSMWGDGAQTAAASAQGLARDEGGAQSYIEGRKLHPPMSGMKASIINELSSKLHERNRSLESWGSQRSLARHR